MVEVAPRSGEISIHYWRYILFLVVLLLIGFIALWSIFGSRWGASNSFMETFRRYITIVNRFKPSTPPEDNLGSALRIHGLEKLGSKRYAVLFSITDKNGDPIAVVRPGDVTIKLGDSLSALQPAVVDQVRPLHMEKSWSDPVSFTNVMDYSGSMFQEDLRAIEANYSSFISNIVLPFSSSVIKFSDSVKEILPLSTNKIDIEAAIKKPIPQENTALYLAVDKGIETVQARPHLRFLLVATDGNDNIGGVTLDDILRRSQQHYVSLFVLGFGWLDVDLLKRMAEETDGYYVYMPDSSKLKDWFPKIARIVNNVHVAEISTTTDRNVPFSVSISVKANGTILERQRK